jgi:hypothetical protein
VFGEGGRSPQPARGCDEKAALFREDCSGRASKRRARANFFYARFGKSRLEVARAERGSARANGDGTPIALATDPTASAHIERGLKRGL